MEFNEYQKLARKTAIYAGAGKNFVYPALGLCGESGEVAEKIKKIVRDRDNVVDDKCRAELEKELGDVLWYIANLAVELDLDLENIAQKNIKKLADRQERGVLHGSGDNR
ncbi:MAG: nucleoside triphosphate pyrophosphohydrolase family protein [Candidatus Yanofskyibacterium parasiticum]|jgi:NTP pyrophosphatase (non-canonical NTP hydrolase)|nr:MAG: nucleoside triphosphate pyrophosphohydrolase family protein [Candidatus Yanofskybacteria bacterium]